MKRSLTRIALALPGALALGACSGAQPSPSDAPYEGHGVAVNIAALDLQGVGDVVWDIEVRNGASPTSEVVFQRRLTSSGYGDSAGSASYIGPCDADPAVAENTVNVWVVGVYADDVSAAGSFNSGSTAGAGAVTGTEVPFQNPTTSAPLSRVFTCVENADTPVQFDVALMRPAQQGFFDIAVNFNDIFCSAKFDCCQDATGDGCASDGTEDIELLFDANGDRARTLVLGFACTAGADPGVVTDLYMDDLALDCTAPNSGVDFDADITISPNGPGGNQCTPGADGMTGCLGTVTELGAVDADDVLFQVAVYRGDESLFTGGDAHKAYWNVALGAKAGVSACRLRTRATADDAANSQDNVVAGVIAQGTVYPYVSFDVDLGSCGSEPLTFGVPGSPVDVAYAGTSDTSAPFGYTWATALASGPVCADGCANGGTCAAPGLCDCSTAPGWAGDTCEDPDCGGALYLFDGSVTSFGQIQPGPNSTYLVAANLNGNAAAIYTFDSDLGFVSGTSSTWRDNGSLYRVYPYDAGWFVTGGGYTPTTNGDPWVIRLASDASITWSRTYGHFCCSYGDSINWIEQTADGGFVTVGTNGNTSAGDQGANLYRYDANFDIQFGRFVGSGYDTNFSMVKELSSGGFVAAGSTSWSTAGGWDGLVARFDASGVFVWAKRFGSTGNDHANGVVLTGDGELVVWGSTDISGDAGTWAVRLDTDGAVVWQTAFSNADVDESLGSSYVRADGGTVIVGSATDADSQDGLVVQLLDDGTIGWGQVIGGPGDESFSGITTAASGDYVLSGTSDLVSGKGGMLATLPASGRFGCGGSCYPDYAPTVTAYPELTITDYARSTSSTSMGVQNVGWSGSNASLSTTTQCAP